MAHRLLNLLFMTTNRVRPFGLFALSTVIGLSTTFAPLSKANALECRDLFRVERVSQRTVTPLKQARRNYSEIYDEPAIADRLARATEALRKKTIAERPQELVESDVKRINDPNWLLDQVQYMGYVNFIGSKVGKGTFKTLNKMVDYLTEKLGVTMLYVLPFLKSPFRDAGFDVSDYKAVDDNFGGNKEYEPFQKKLLSKNGTFQMDIILNHISAEHAWAKAALAGDPKFRDYLIVLQGPPSVVSVDLDPATGYPMSAKYKEVNPKTGEIEVIERRVIFPEFADPKHPHYVKLKDGKGKDVWVYHTFYPFQFDLNYRNPKVVYEAMKIVGYWANRGVDVIRLDAIPFLFKERESDPRTMKIVESLRYFLSQVSPRTAIIVEANQPPPTVYKYYGKGADIRVDHLGMNLTSTTGGQLAYNFDLMGYSWASLATGKASFFLESLARTPEPPPGTVWAHFMRLHDELTLEMVPDSVRDPIRKAYLDTKKGVPFRGDLGVGGRMGDFLGRDPRQMKLANMMLMTLKGMPILYYGDEIMAGNNHKYAEKAAEERGGQFDARDVGRGPIGEQEFLDAAKVGNKSPEAQVLNDTARLIQVRKQSEALRRGGTEILGSSNESVAAYKRVVPGGQKALVLLNFSDKPATTTVRAKDVPSDVLELVTEKKMKLQRSGDLITITLSPFEGQVLGY